MKTFTDNTLQGFYTILMTQIHPSGLSTTECHHRYDDSLYGETPLLPIGDDQTSATDLARLFVKLGVDGRGPQAERASAEEMVEGIPRLTALHRATAGPGFAIDLRLAGPDGNGSVRASYTFAPNEAGLLVADRPPGSESGRLFDLRWVLDDGHYVPQQSEEPIDMDAAADAYADVWSRVTDPNSNSPLEVVRANLNPYLQLSSLSLGTTVVTQRPPSA